MSKEMVVSTTAHETKVAILEDNEVVELYFERDQQYSLAGSIYKGRVTRVLPGMQSAFVDIGLQRDAFLYVSDFLEDAEDFDRVMAKAEEKGPRNGERAAEAQPAAAPEGAPAEDAEDSQNRAPQPPPAPPRQPAGFSRQPGYERKPGGYERQPAGYQRQPGGYDRQPSGYRRQPSGNVRQPSGNVKPSEGGMRGRDGGMRQGGQADDRRFGRRGRRGGRRNRRFGPDRSFPDQKYAMAAEASRGQQMLGVTSARQWGFDVMPGESVAKYHGLPADEPEETYGAQLPVAEGAAALAQDMPAEEATAEENVTRAEPVELEDMAAAGSRAAEMAVPEPAVEATAEPVEVIPADVQEMASDEEAPSEADSEGPAAEASGEEEEDAQPQEAGQPQPAVEAGVRERPSGRRNLYRDFRRRRRGAKPDSERQPQEPKPDAASGEAAEAKPQTSITDLLKEGQEIIVQIAKEPIAQKGARITSHLALPGRYLVYMPTVDHVGVSRKIQSDEERQRLKRVVQEHRVGMPGGFVVRTAGDNHTDDEIRADMDFLYNLWLDLRQKAESKPSPALIHHDLGLVERILRDQLAETFKTLWVDTEDDYQRILQFLERSQPSLLSRVKLYTRSNPIFEEFGATAEVEKALRPRVWLKSGGYIVINQTEALVAIDVNTGKYVGKSNRLEDTIVKTNLEAAQEIARQIRLRDLGGIIVADFIDMEERKNRQKVLQALDEALRRDRAPSKVLQFNDFGLVAITRKRVRQSLERTLCSACPYCDGSGFVKSVATMVQEIMAEARKQAPGMERRDAILRVHPEVARVLKSRGNTYLEEVEAVIGRPVLVKSDPLLHQEKFDLN